MRAHTSKKVAFFGPLVGWSVGWLIGWLVGWSVGPLLGGGPEGADDLCFHTGKFFPPSSPSPSSPSTPFEAHILALRLKSQP